MPFQDLHEYLEKLESLGKLYRVKTEVDKEWEVSTVFRTAWERYSEENRYPILFERIKNHRVPVLAGAFGTSRQIYASALDTTPEAIFDRWSAALSHPLEPIMVKDGPCKERMIEKDDVDLSGLPICRWHVQNRAPYITSGYVVTKDPDSGKRNVGTYASMLIDRNHLTLRGAATGGMGSHHKKYEERGLSMPVAIVIGADPTIGMASVASVPEEIEEFALSGALRQRPVELVKCHTVDLEVPAGAETVLEGLVPPKERAQDGPHVDHCGFQLPPRQVRLLEVRCITRRHNPIHQEFDEGKPPNESTTVRGIATECLVRHLMVKELGIHCIRNVRLTEGSSGFGTWIIAIDKTSEDDPMKVAAALLSTAHVHKRVIIVDADVDIFNDTEIEWTQSFCVRWDRDLKIVPHRGLHPLDPSVGPAEHHIQGGGNEGYFQAPSELPAAAVVDATRKAWFPPVGRFPEQNRQLVQDKWPGYRLP